MLAAAEYLQKVKYLQKAKTVSRKGYGFFIVKDTDIFNVRIPESDHWPWIMDRAP